MANFNQNAEWGGSDSPWQKPYTKKKKKVPGADLENSLTWSQCD